MLNPRAPFALSATVRGRHAGGTPTALTRPGSLALGLAEVQAVGALASTGGVGGSVPSPELSAQRRLRLWGLALDESSNPPPSLRGPRTVSGLFLQREKTTSKDH